MKKWEKPYVNNLNIGMTEKSDNATLTEGCNAPECAGVCFQDTALLKAHVKSVHGSDDWKSYRLHKPTYCKVS